MVPMKVSSLRLAPGLAPSVLTDNFRGITPGHQQFSIEKRRDLLEAVKRLDLEGIVAKRKAIPADLRIIFRSLRADSLAISTDVSDGALGLPFRLTAWSFFSFGL